MEGLRVMFLMHLACMTSQPEKHVESVVQRLELFRKYCKTMDQGYIAALRDDGLIERHMKQFLLRLVLGLNTDRAKLMS